MLGSRIYRPTALRSSVAASAMPHRRWGHKRLQLHTESHSITASETSDEMDNKVAALGHLSARGVPSKSAYGIIKAILILQRPVANSVKSTAVALQKLTQQVDANQNVLKETDARCRRLEKSVAGVKTKVDGLEMSMAGLETKVGGLETKVDGLEKSMAEVKTGVAEVKTGVAGLEKSVKSALVLLKVMVFLFVLGAACLVIRWYGDGFIGALAAVLGFAYTLLSSSTVFC